VYGTEPVRVCTFKEKYYACFSLNGATVISVKKLQPQIKKKKA
jgi:hypothetical protein